MGFGEICSMIECRILQKTNSVQLDVTVGMSKCSGTI